MVQKNLTNFKNYLKGWLVDRFNIKEHPVKTRFLIRKSKPKIKTQEFFPLSFKNASSRISANKF